MAKRKHHKKLKEVSESESESRSESENESKSESYSESKSGKSDEETFSDYEKNSKSPKNVKQVRPPQKLEIISFLDLFPREWGHPYPTWQSVLFLPILVGSVIFLIGQNHRQDILYPIFGSWRSYGYPFVVALLNMMAVFVMQRGDSKSAGVLKGSICFAGIVFGIAVGLEIFNLFNDQYKYYYDWCSDAKGTMDNEGCSNWMLAFIQQVAGAIILALSSVAVGFFASLNGRYLESQGFIEVK